MVSLQPLNLTDKRTLHKTVLLLCISTIDEVTVRE
jgi:hypothetical protein